MMVRGGDYPATRYWPRMAGNVVFISYAHEPGEQRDRVLELARALLRAGWDVRLDLYQGRPDGGWPRWMASQVDAADRILCVCTPTYRRRFEGEQARHGLGVSWEGYLITSMLYRERGRSERVIPVWCLPSSLAAEGRSVTCLAPIRATSSSPPKHNALGKPIIDDTAAPHRG